MPTKIMNTRTTSPSQDNNNETVQQLTNIFDLLDCSIFMHVEKFDKWIKEANSSFITATTTAINNSYINKSLEKISNSVDVIANASLAIMSAIYGRQYKATDNLSSVKIDNALLSKSILTSKQMHFDTKLLNGVMHAIEKLAKANSKYIDYSDYFNKLYEVLVNPNQELMSVLYGVQDILYDIIGDNSVSQPLNNILNILQAITDSNINKSNTHKVDLSTVLLNIESSISALLKESNVSLDSLNKTISDEILNAIDKLQNNNAQINIQQDTTQINIPDYTNILNTINDKINIVDYTSALNNINASIQSITDSNIIESLSEISTLVDLIAEYLFNQEPINIIDYTDILNSINDSIGKINQSNGMDVASSINDLTTMLELLIEQVEQIDISSITSGISDMSTIMEIMTEHVEKMQITDIANDISDMHVFLDTLTEHVEHIRTSILSKPLQVEHAVALSDNDNKFLDTLNNVATKAGDNINMSKEGKDAITIFLNSLAGIANFDKTKLHQINKNIRKITKLFGEPTILTRAGLSSTGLMTLLFERIDFITSRAKSTSDQTNALAHMLENIVSVIKLDPDEIENGIDSLWALNDMFTFSADMRHHNFIGLIFNTAAARNLLLKHFPEFEKDSNNKNSIFSSFLNIIQKFTNTFDYKNIIDSFDSLEIYNNFFTNVKSTIDLMLGVINGFDIKQIEQNTVTIAKIKELLVNLSKITDKINIGDLLLNSVKLSLLTSVGQQNKTILKSINKINIADIKEAQDKLNQLNSGVFTTLDESVVKMHSVFKALKKINTILTTTAILGKGAIAGIKQMNKTLNALQEMFDNLKDYKLDEKAVNRIDEISKVIKKLNTTILMAGAMGMATIALLPAIIGFAFSFRLFLFFVFNSVKVFSLKAPIAIAELAVISGVITTCAGVMMLGALFILIPNMVRNALLFGPILGLFVLSVLGSVSLISMVLRLGGMANAAQIGIMIGLLGGTMMMGALFIMIPGFIPAALSFGVILSIFLMMTLGSVTLISRLGGRRTMMNVKQLGLMIGLLGGVLMLGSLFMMVPGMATGALKFIGLMSLFVIATVGLLTLIAKIATGGGAANRNVKGLMQGMAGNNANKNILAIATFGTLIMMLGATMIVGALFMMIPNMAVNALKFIGLTALFIISTVGVLTLASIFLNEKNKATVMMLAGLTIAIAGVMLFAGYMMIKYPEMDKGILKFVGLSLLMVGGMGIIMGLLGTFVKGSTLAWGALGLAAISLNILLLGKCLKPMIEAYRMTQEAGGVEKLNDFMKTTGVVLLAAAGAIGALGGIFVGTGGIGAAVFAAGVAGMVSLAASMKLIGEAMKSVAEGASAMNGTDPKVIEKSIDIFKDTIKSLKELIDGDNVKIAKKAAKVAKEIGWAMASICIGIQAYANLSVPEYDNTGKVTGRRQIKEEDFANAATNISTIIKTIGEALIETYKTAPKGMFNAAGPFGLGNTPFDKVVQGSTRMGDMIAKIAEGIKTYASLSIPKYDSTGKIIGKEPLSVTDFEKAADNISTIITTIGAALINLYNGDVKNLPQGMSKAMLHRMFTMREYVLFGDSPFEKVLGATTKMGEMIGNISKGVIDFASGKIPTAYDKEGNPTAWTNLSDLDTTQLTENISKVVTAIGTALISVYSTKPEAFNYGAGSALANIGTAIGNTCAGLSGVKDIVLAFVSGKMPIVDAEGKVTSVIDIPLDELANENADWIKGIKNLITAVPGALIGVYKEHEKGLFDNTNWIGAKKDSPYEIMVACLEKSNSTISSCLNAFDEVNKKIKSETNKNGIDIDSLSSKISNMITTLPAAIMSAAYVNGKLKPMFEKTDHFDKIKKAFDNILPIVKSLAESYVELNNNTAIKDTLVTQTNNKLRTMLLDGGFINIFNESFADIKLDVKKVENANKVYTNIGELAKTSIDILKLINENVESIDNISKLYTLFAGINNSGINNIKLNELDIAGINSYYATVYDITATTLDTLKLVSENKDYIENTSLLENLITGMNTLHLDETGDTTNFERETYSLRNFVNSVNSVDLNKANKMMELLASLKKSIDAQSSAKFQQMMNQLINVISLLTEELDRTSHTMKNADNIRAKRQEQINNTIEEMKKMLDNPIEVVVTDDNSSTDSDASTSGPSSMSASPRQNKGLSKMNQNWSKLFNTIAQAQAPKTVDNSNKV